ncbi:MAG: hypothetical protein HONBIEJF_02104 [Fimbriimonadaceae bacterium]|nr:hypothetical protein [Fimbriimonadaceae bacterium]
MQSISIQPDDPVYWRRKAAELGPGYRGHRAFRTSDHIRAAADAFRSLGEPPPSYLFVESGWTDRPAKLFEAGDYPDKGVSVTQDDLAAIASSFDLPVPVWIEHAETPLDLGYLTAVEAQGGELFGTITLTQEADALIERSGARSLSIGLSPDLRQIREVSLVKHPRIASARLFAAAVAFEGELQPTATDDRRQRLAEAEQRLDDLEVERTLEGLFSQGRLVPAQKPYAKALLSQRAGVAFSGESLTVAELVLRLLESAPDHGLFREHASTADAEAAANLLLPEEADFYRRYFPDIDLKDIANTKQ